MRKLIELLLRLFGKKKKGCHPEYKGKGNHPDFPNDRPVHGSDGFDYIPRIVTGNGRTFFGTNRGWRSHTPGCELWEVAHVKPKLIQNFKDAELRDIIPEKDRVIVATRTDMKGGSVWELVGV